MKSDVTVFLLLFCEFWLKTVLLLCRRATENPSIGIYIVAFFFKGDTSFLLISVIKPLYYFDNAEGLQFPVSLHITFKRLFNADDVGFTGTRASLTFQSKSAAIDT